MRALQPHEWTALGFLGFVAFGAAFILLRWLLYPFCPRCGGRCDRQWLRWTKGKCRNCGATWWLI